MLEEGSDWNCPVLPLRLPPPLLQSYASVLPAQAHSIKDSRCTAAPPRQCLCCSLTCPLSLSYSLPSPSLPLQYLPSLSPAQAHSIKDRRCSTAKAVFALQSRFKWALSGTPLQNRVAELYSLVRFLQVDPYSYYFCRKCDCQSLDFM